MYVRVASCNIHYLLSLHPMTNFPANSFLGDLRLPDISNVLSFSLGSPMIFAALIAYLPSVTPLEDARMLTFVFSRRVKAKSNLDQLTCRHVAGEKDYMSVALLFGADFGASVPEIYSNFCIYLGGRLQNLCKKWNIKFDFLHVFWRKAKERGARRVEKWNCGYYYM